MKRARILLCLSMAILITLLSSCSGELADAKNQSYDAIYDADGFAPSTEAPAEGPMYDDFKYEYSYNGDLGYSTESDMYVPDTPAQSAGGTDPQPVPDSARKLIKNVSMDIETLTFEDFMADLYNRISAAGGYIQSSSENAGRYSSRYAYMRSAYVTARIPADRLDSFCNGIEGVCNVVSRREETSDVTLQYYDTESHMRALQSEYETLVSILEKCTMLEDVISVQSRITDVLYQIESYKTRLNNYDNLVAYSTVTLSISEVKEETVVTEQTLGERIASGFSGTLKNMREGMEDFAVGFVANLPYILIWALIIIVAIFVIRKAVRRLRVKHAKRHEAEKPADTENTEN